MYVRVMRFGGTMFKLMERNNRIIMYGFREDLTPDILEH